MLLWGLSAVRAGNVGESRCLDPRNPRHEGLCKQAALWLQGACPRVCCRASVVLKPWNQCRDAGCVPACAQREQNPPPSWGCHSEGRLLPNGYRPLCRPVCVDPEPAGWQHTLSSRSCLWPNKQRKGLKGFSPKALSLQKRDQWGPGGGAVGT